MPENIYRIGRQELKERLDKILKEDFPFGIMIKGEWGIGKTYFWREFISKFEKENKGIKTAYISLFEAESLKEIKRDIIVQLFSKKIPLIEKVVKFLKIDLSFKFPLKFSASPEGLLYLLPHDLKAILCFDEFERLNLNKIDLETLLGLISFFKENNSCKVIMIINEEEFVNKLNTFKELYNKYKEKIVDYEFLFKPSFEDNFSIASKNLKLKDYEPIIRELGAETQVSNLRVLNNLIKIINEFELINSQEFNGFRKEIKEIFIKKLATLTLEKFQNPKIFEENLYEYLKYFDAAIVRYLKTGFIDKQQLYYNFTIESKIFENRNKKETLFSSVNKIYNSKVEISEILNEIWTFLESEKDNILSILSTSGLAVIINFILTLDPSGESKNRCVNYAVDVLKKFIDENYNNILEGIVWIWDSLASYPKEVRESTEAYLKEKERQLRTVTGKEDIKNAVKKILSGSWNIKDEQILLNSDPKEIVEYMKEDPEVARLIFKLFDFVSHDTSELESFRKKVISEINNDPSYSDRFELIMKIRKLI